MSSHQRSSWLTVVVAWCLRGAQSKKAKVPIAEDGLDAFGCAISRGELWCEAQSRCVQQYDVCDPGLGDVEACTYSWAGLTWDLSPLRRSTHYTVRRCHFGTRVRLETFRFEMYLRSSTFLTSWVFA